MKNKFLIVLLVVLPSILLSQNKTTIAVLDFDALGISVTETNVIIDRLRTEIFKTNKYILLERKKMKDILDEQGFQMSGCTTNECVVEAGQLLGVQQMIVGSIGKVSDVFTITARITDVETGKILKVANYDNQGDLSGLLTKGMRELAFELSDEQIKESNINKQKDTFVNEIQEGTITDIDGNVYKTVKIGSQVWMAENLKVTRYRNGDLIPNVTSASEWKSLSTGAYCNYDNNSSNANTYGRLYNWYAVNDRRNIAPEGWHVPTDEEWTQLEKYLGSDEGGKLKERGTSHWLSPNTGATNTSGFTALPAGYRFAVSDGRFGNLGHHGSWWSSTDINSRNAWYRHLRCNNSVVYRFVDYKQYGCSVRLVRD